jgi:hypothetical protein
VVDRPDAVRQNRKETRVPRETVILALGGAFSSAVCLVGLSQTDEPAWLRLFAATGAGFGLWCVGAAIRAEVSIRRGFRRPR